MKVTQIKIIISVAGLLLTAITANAQPPLVSNDLLGRTITLTKQLPANIHDAHQQYRKLRQACDSLDLLLSEAYPLLANRMEKRSARLNALVNSNEPTAKLLLLPPNEKMMNYFIQEWDKMDALEKTFNQKVKSIEGLKEKYKVKGYLAVWDSAYASRQPALIAYRDGVLKLVQAELVYLKASGKMFLSKNEDERMQWVEAELGVLQKVVLLKEKFKKLVLEEGAEKVQFCIDNPGACSAALK